MKIYSCQGVSGFLNGQRYLFIAWLILLQLFRAPATDAQEHYLALEADSISRQYLARMEIALLRPLDSALWEKVAQQVLNDVQWGGYFDATLGTPTWRHDTLELPLELGLHYLGIELRLDSVARYWLGVTGYDTLQREVLTLSGLANVKEGVVGSLTRMGFPFAKVGLTAISWKEKHLLGTLEVIPGPLFVWDTLGLEGWQGLSPSRLAALLDLRVGEPYNEENLNLAVSRLRTIEYVALSGEPRVHYRYGKAKVFLPLKGKKGNRVDGILGLRTTDSRLILMGTADVEAGNLLGQGIGAVANWQRIDLSSQRLQVGVRYPSMFNSPVGGSAQFWMLLQDSSHLRGDAIVNIQIPIYKTHEVILGGRRVWGNPLPGNEGESLAGTKATYGGVGINAKMNEGFQNKHFDAMFWVGNRTIDTLLTSARFSWAFETSLFWQREWQIGWGAEFKGQLGLLGGELLYVSELYRLGGLNSLRGFGERVLAAQHYFTWQGEGYYSFNGGNALVAFLDGGMLYDRTNGGRIPVGVGAGFRLRNESSAFSLLAGSGLLFGSEQPFSGTTLHVGYKTFF